VADGIHEDIDVTNHSRSSRQALALSLTVGSECARRGSGMEPRTHSRCRAASQISRRDGRGRGSKRYSSEQEQMTAKSLIDSWGRRVRVIAPTTTANKVSCDRDFATTVDPPYDLKLLRYREKLQRSFSLSHTSL